MGVPAWMTNEESQTDSLDELQHAMGEGEIYTKELVQQEQRISTYHVGSSMHGSKERTIHMPPCVTKFTVTVPRPQVFLLLKTYIALLYAKYRLPLSLAYGTESSD